ncbi:MAG TPA: hypothetical protein DHV55_03385 [Clostridiaceae bacterium]|nr:hypothetical protein [Clostridiaceae bacterium]
MLTQEYERNGDNEIIKIKRQLHIYSQENEEIAYESEIKEIGNSENVKDEIIRKIKIDSRGNIYTLKLNGSIEIFDEKLNNLHKLEKDTYWDMDLDENDNLITLRYTKTYEKILEGMDTKKYSVIWQKEYPKEQGPYMIYYNKDTKTLYGLNRSIISKYDVEKDAISKLLDYSKLSAVEYVDAIAVDKDEVIYVCGSFKDESKLFQYIKTDEKTAAANDIKKEINFEARDYVNYFSNAAKQFEKENPQIKVNVTNIVDIPYEEYSERLNTELMVGKGPDIICGFGYYTKDYMDKGLMVNMDEMIKTDEEFHINDYYSSIIDGSRYNDCLYTLPLTYLFDCFVANEKLLEEKGIEISDDWTWKDFYKAVTTDKRCYAIPQFEHDENYGLEDLIKDDADYYIDWKKKIARFDSKEFLAALKLLKSIKIKFMHPEADASRRDADNLSKLEEAVLFYPMYIGRYLDLNFFSRYSNGKIVLPSPKGEYSDAKTFKSFNASINDGSKNKEEAWKFVKYLLSEEIQFYISENDFVINKKADERRISEYLAKMKETNRLEESNAYVENLNIIRSNLNNNSSFVPQDELFNTIWEEIKVYLSGSRSAEETAKTIQNKVELYLNE